jgi:hypothetical protein
MTCRGAVPAPTALAVDDIIQNEQEERWECN